MSVSREIQISSQREVYHELVTLRVSSVNAYYLDNQRVESTEGDAAMTECDMCTSARSFAIEQSAVSVSSYHRALSSKVWEHIQ